MPPFGCFSCCLAEDGGKTVEVVGTSGHTTGEEQDHFGHTPVKSHAAVSAAVFSHSPAYKAPVGPASPTTAAAISAAIAAHPDDILAQPRKLGNPCRKNMPRIGDIVLSMSGKKVGHDSKGNAKAWVLHPGQCAEVVEIDADGDFRLRNIFGVESGFLFRKDFGQAYDPDAEEAEAMARERDALTIQQKRKSPNAPFDVVVEHAEGTSLGLSVDTMCPYHLEINEVHEGLIRKYNQGAPPGKAVKEGYFVVGTRGNLAQRDEILVYMKQAGQISLRIAPNDEFSCSMAKSGKVGLFLLVEPKCRSLLVKKVSPGSVEDYNVTVPDDMQVKEGDRIVEVNGIRGDCDKMLELTRVDGGDLSFVVSRPAAEFSVPTPALGR